MAIGKNEFRVKMKNFTEDLLIEILSWLPVICLVRFRCVCKSWLALLESPNFISKHLKNSPDSIIRSRRIGHFDTYTSLSCETLDVITEDLGFQIQYFYSGPFVDPELFGCFNGIACLYDRWQKNIIFWNPALRHMKILPKPSFVAPPIARCRVEIGFGFDFKTNDFKVVMIHIISTYSEIYDPLPPYQTEVYSLSTDSWRLIDTVIPYGLGFYPNCNSRICVKGVYSKLMRRLDRASKPIHFSMLTFNMTDEVFILTPMPREVYTFRENKHLYKELTELNGSVAYITYVIEPTVRVNFFEISVLDEYGPNGTWTKLYTIGPFFHLRRPLGFWKKDELFFETNYHELVLCCLVTNKIKKLNVQGSFFNIYQHKESLYSLN